MRRLYGATCQTFMVWSNYIVAFFKQHKPTAVVSLELIHTRHNTRKHFAFHGKCFFALRNMKLCFSRNAFATRTYSMSKTNRKRERENITHRPLRIQQQLRPAHRHLAPSGAVRNSSAGGATLCSTARARPQSTVTGRRIFSLNREINRCER